MTLQKRFVIGPKDVLAIRLTCKHCKASVSIPPSEFKCVRDACANCREQLFHGDSTKIGLEQLIAGLADLQKCSDDMGWSVHLEAEQPE